MKPPANQPEAAVNSTLNPPLNGNLSLTKQCSKCNKTKPLDAFYRRHNGKLGRGSQCKACLKVANDDRVAADPDFYKRKYANKIAKDPHYESKRKLRKKYGLSLARYNQMFDAQNGVCAICGDQETATTARGVTVCLSVDHNHETGKVRGLLCRRCNSVLGFVDDNPKILAEAIRYLL